MANATSALEFPCGSLDSPNGTLGGSNGTFRFVTHLFTSLFTAFFTLLFTVENVKNDVKYVVKKGVKNDVVERQPAPVPKRSASRHPSIRGSPFRDRTLGRAPGCTVTKQVGGYKARTSSL